MAEQKKTRADIERLKSVARQLYLSGMELQEIAEKVNVSRVTLSRWVKEGGWKEARAAKNVTRPELVNKLLLAIDNLITQMKERGYGVKKLISTEYTEDMSLTDRQEEVIRYAFDNGYYEVPKRINLDDLSERFGISKSTVSVIIRDAEKKLITYCLTSSDGHYDKR